MIGLADLSSRTAVPNGSVTELEVGPGAVGRLVGR